MPAARVASARLWNAIEKRGNQYSRRGSAQLAREIAFGLPEEIGLTPVEGEMTLQAFSNLGHLYSPTRQIDVVLVSEHFRWGNRHRICLPRCTDWRDGRSLSSQ